MGQQWFGFLQTISWKLTLNVTKGIEFLDHFEKSSVENELIKVFWENRNRFGR